VYKLVQDQNFRIQGLRDGSPKKKAELEKCVASWLLVDAMASLLSHISRLLRHLLGTLCMEGKGGSLNTR